MEKENMELHEEVRENVVAQERADAKTAEIFAFFDEVRLFVFRVLRLWQCSRLSVLTCAIGFGFTDLCKMERSSFGGYASVDTIDCRDSERRQHSAVMHGGTSVDLCFMVFSVHLRNVFLFFIGLRGSESDAVSHLV